MYLFAQGESCEGAVMEHLLGGRYPTRAVNENLADLRAQVASCRAGAALFLSLQATHGTRTVEDQLNQLYARAARYSGEALALRLSSPVKVREVLDDGSEIRVQLGHEADRFTVRFEGTSLRHPANLHATPAIVRSALIYVIRLLQERDLPLNEGLLDKVDVRLPTCFLNPDFGSEPLPPVVGGNVETSQRLVEALLQSFELVAGSQGTMNNLIFGNEDVSYYETICGGSGAGPGFSGASGVHTHMTNTAITDPEILEWRYPVRLRRFALRRGSGGQGKWAGGDGVVRELEFLAPLAVSLLTQHRCQGPRGRAGGLSGAPGRQTLLSRGKQTELDALASVDVVTGDRLVVETPGGGGWGKCPLQTQSAPSV
jgi:5-oxoprolinase (ATP-hydrolysing)